MTETSTYDLAGNLLTQTGPPFAATIAGQPVTTQLVTTHTYDAWGHETASSAPCLIKRRSGWYKAGMVAR